MKSVAVRMSLVALLSSGLSVSAQSAAPSSDCTAKQAPQGFSRIFIASRVTAAPRQAGSGTASDPYDGSTAQKFDGVLRTRSEAHQENLIVCIGAGTFETEGTYDFIVNVPHKTVRGFTLNKNWKVHGAGVDKTTLKLVSFFGNPSNMAKSPGVGVVFSTYNDAASGIEISDLTIDDNYSALKPVANQQGITGLNLDAIHLRADEGGHWIHRVKVIHPAGETGEVFTVWLISMNNKSPAVNSGNIIEYVTLSDPGADGCTGITIANALGEVRNNQVTGYAIGYGAWSSGKVAFHDNVAIDTTYGFNIDSWDNDGVRIYNNQIIHPKKWGLVIGGGKRYANFQITGNTIQINAPSAIGIFLTGNVTNALIENNKFIADPPASTGTLRTISERGRGNQGNIERSNQTLSGNGQSAGRP
jgi:hypothetical protein